MATNPVRVCVELSVLSCATAMPGTAIIEMVGISICLGRKAPEFYSVARRIVFLNFSPLVCSYPLVPVCLSALVPRSFGEPDAGSKD